MKAKQLNFTKLKWDCIQVIIWFEDEDDYEYSIGYFRSCELENEHFVELLVYLNSHGGTKYKDWFDEFIYIPKQDNGNPKVICSTSIIKFDDGKVFSV